MKGLYYNRWLEAYSALLMAAPLQDRQARLAEAQERFLQQQQRVQQLEQQAEQLQRNLSQAKQHEAEAEAAKQRAVGPLTAELKEVEDKIDEQENVSKAGSP